MTQRNPMNERYQTDERQGKTRKSASQAKPVTKAASTTRDPAPKTKKEKRQEERERIRKEEEKAKAIGVSPDTLASVQYRNYRRLYWVALIGGGVCALASFVLSSMGENYTEISTTLIMAAYIMIIAALFIDITKVRKYRKNQMDNVPRGKSKEARRQQKEHAAQERARKKYLEERYQEAQQAGEQPKPSFIDRLKARFSSKGAETAKDATEDAAPSGKTASATPKRVTSSAAEAEKAADAASDAVEKAAEGVREAVEGASAEK